MDLLTEAFLGFKAGLTRLVRRIVSNPVDVEDIVYEAYLRSFEASKSQAIESPKAFIARTARNLALNHIMSAAERWNESIDYEDPLVNCGGEVSVEDHVEADRQFAVFCQAVERLPKQCRKVFTLKQVYGLSQKEIAERLGISEKTVEYHVSRGLLYCRRYLSAVQSGSELPERPDRTSRGIRGIRQ